MCGWIYGLARQCPGCRYGAAPIQERPVDRLTMQSMVIVYNCEVTIILLNNINVQSKRMEKTY